MPALLALLLLPAADVPLVSVGSKAFVESNVLGELCKLLVEDAGVPCEHVKNLNDTTLAWNSLQRGAIDAYVEYTGTLSKEIFAGQGLSPEGIRAELARRGLAMSAPLGFANSYAIGMRRAHADELGIRTISDLAKHPGLRVGASHAFLERPDGWRGLKARYGLPQATPPVLTHALAYLGLGKGRLDVIDVYTTDADIRRFDVRELEDDRRFFPPYDAVLLYRLDLRQRAPKALESLLRLQGAIDTNAMMRMNNRVTLDAQTADVAAGEFFNEKLGGDVVVVPQTVAGRIGWMTLQHLMLVLFSLVPAILVAVPLGVAAARRPLLGHAILGVVGVVQTFPALALLTLLVVATGEIGFLPALIALFLYSLLPIVRNTVTGMQDIPLTVRESAEALGLSSWDKLRLVELPMASRSILAGIKTAAVINVGFATLGGLVGAGGYGDAIVAGLNNANWNLLLQGAIPSVAMALAVQGLFDVAGWALVPKGLRLKPAE